MRVVFRHSLHRPTLSTSITAQVIDFARSLHTKDNDRLFLVSIHGMRIKVRLAFRTIPAHRLFHPNLLISAECIQLPKRESHDRLSLSLFLRIYYHLLRSAFMNFEIR